MSGKAKNMRVSTRATGLYVAAKVSQMRDDLKVAKQMTEQEVRIREVVKAQEKRDKYVADLKQAIADTEERLTALREELTKATEVAESVEFELIQR